MLTLRPRDFGSHKTPSKFRQHTQRSSPSIPTLKTSHFRQDTKTKLVTLHTLKQSDFGQNKKTKPIMTPTQKTSQFRCIHENQTSIGPNTTKPTPIPHSQRKIILYSHTKPSKFLSRTQKPSLFRPHH